MSITMSVDNLMSHLNVTRQNSKDVSLKDLEKLFSNEFNEAINFDKKNAAQQTSSQAGELTIEQNADGTATVNFIGGGSHTVGQAGDNVEDNVAALKNTYGDRIGNVISSKLSGETQVSNAQAAAGTDLEPSIPQLANPDYNYGSAILINPNMREIMESKNAAQQTSSQAGELTIEKNADGTATINFIGGGSHTLGQAGDYVEDNVAALKNTYGDRIGNVVSSKLSGETQVSNARSSLNYLSNLYINKSITNFDLYIEEL